MSTKCAVRREVTVLHIRDPLCTADSDHHVPPIMKNRPNNGPFQCRVGLILPIIV